MSVLLQLFALTLTLTALSPLTFTFALTLTLTLPSRRQAEVGALPAGLGLPTYLLTYLLTYLPTYLLTGKLKSERSLQVFQCRNSGGKVQVRSGARVVGVTFDGHV